MVSNNSFTSMLHLLTIISCCEYQNGVNKDWWWIQEKMSSFCPYAWECDWDREHNFVKFISVILLTCLGAWHKHEECLPYVTLWVILHIHSKFKLKWIQHAIYSISVNSWTWFKTKFGIVNALFMLDEAHFHFSCYVNKCFQHWASHNLHEHHQHPIHSLAWHCDMGYLLLASLRMMWIVLWPSTLSGVMMQNYPG